MLSPMRTEFCESDWNGSKAATLKYNSECLQFSNFSVLDHDIHLSGMEDSEEHKHYCYAT